MKLLVKILVLSMVGSAAYAQQHGRGDRDDNRRPGHDDGRGGRDGRGDRDDGRGGRDGRGDRDDRRDPRLSGSIGNTQVRCGRNAQVCDTNVQWESNSRDTFVTVQVANTNDRVESQERLMSCTNYSGNTHVPWIRPNDTYIFRLYSGSCPRADRSGAPSPRDLQNELDSLVIRVRR